MRHQHTPVTSVKTANDWADIRKKIVFSVMYNRAIKRMNDWGSGPGVEFEKFIKYLNANNTVKANNGGKTTFKKAAPYESKDHAENVNTAIATLTANYPFAHYLNNWNFEKSIISFTKLLIDQRNFFSHGYHQPIKWKKDEQDALQKLYEKAAEANKEDKERLLTRPLFQHPGQPEGVLTLQGAIFFVSLFLTSAEVNEMFDSLEKITDLFFNRQKDEEIKAYKILNFNPKRHIYVYWSKKGAASLIPDVMETKRFYDLANYLRKCPVEALQASTEIKEKYGMRGKDFFIYYAYKYFTDFNTFKRLVFKGDDTPVVKNNNIYFYLYETAEKTGTPLKAYMGEEVLQRMLVKLLSGKLTAEDIEDKLSTFIKGYYDKPVAEIDRQKLPLPRNVLLRIDTQEEGMADVLDKALIARLQWVINKLKLEKPADTSSGKADYIISRWNRWNLFYAAQFPERNITAFPQKQFIKLRALTTNYRHKKSEIIKELITSKRYGGIIKDINETATDTDSVYDETMKQDLAFCRYYLERKEDRIEYYDGLAAYLNIKNPFRGNHTIQFSNSIPTPVNKKIFEGKSNLTNTLNTIELIGDYYALEKEKFTAPNFGITDSAERQKEHRQNKQIWKLKQRDEILAAIAVKYLEKILSIQTSNIKVQKFSLTNLDDELARLRLHLSFTVYKDEKNKAVFKKINFDFDDYKKAQNRLVLHNLKNIVFSDKFNGKQELDFRELQPELEAYLNSQIKCIQKVLELESWVYDKNPSLKTDAAAVYNKGQYEHIKFPHFLPNVPDLKKHFDSYLSYQPKPYPYVNITETNYYEKFVNDFRVKALHTNLPFVNGNMPDDYFQPAIDFITYYLSKQGVE